MVSLRTPEGEKAYSDYRATRTEEDGCALCDAVVLKTFSHWKVIPNKFPYDRIAGKHNMIIPIRHVVEEELTTEERTEFFEIKDEVTKGYNWIIEATPSTKSIPEHFHLHLVAGKM